MNIEFDEASHAYKVNGLPVPSVTQVITEVLGSGYEFLDSGESEYYMMRGRAIHLAAAMIAKGISFELPDNRIAGHVAALRKFHSLVVESVESAEQCVASELHRFAGTYDLIAKVNGKRALIDFKSSLANDVRLSIQLGGYALAIGKDAPKIGYGVVLSEDGNFKMTKAIDLADGARKFIACRSVFFLREKLNLLSSQTTKQKESVV